MSRSTFKILFYVNKSKEKQGIVPVMGRVTINGTQSQFSCKKSIPLDMWDVKGNCAKGRSKEALQINRDLDNIKAQIIKHYQHLSDREAFVTAEMVRNAYQGFGSEYETLLSAFDKDIANQKKRVGKDRVASTLWAMQRSRKDVAEFIQSHYRRTDMSMLELTPEFIKDFSVYLSTDRGLASTTKSTASASQALRDRKMASVTATVATMPTRSGMVWAMKVSIFSTFCSIVFLMAPVVVPFR